MYSKAMLIYNGNAGQKEVDQLLSQVIGPLSQAIPMLGLFQTQKPGDAERYCRQYGEQVELVIALGGDGTVHECINGIAPLDKRPAFTVLPAGTCNDFARALSIPLNLKQAAEWIASEPGEKSIDVVQSNNRYFDNFWGTGLIAQASENIDADSKGVFGKLSYYMSAVKTLSDPEQFGFRIEVNDRVIEEEGVIVVAMNGRFIGATEFPLSSISVSDGKMDLMIVREGGFQLLREFISAKTTFNWEENQTLIEHIQTDHASIYLKKEQLVDLDGEHYEGEHFELRVLPEHIRILCSLEETPVAE